MLVVRAQVVSITLALLCGTSCAKPLPDTGGTSHDGSSSGSNETSTGLATSPSMADGTTAADASGTEETSTEPACGNGTIDEGEACDGDSLPPEADCAARGFGEGVPGCLADCSMLDYSACPRYVLCGNGEVGFGEECDGAVFGGGMESCDDFPNLTGDGLACSDRCTYDTTACTTCQESGEPCIPGDTCCNAKEECAVAAQRCCVLNGLGMCTN